MKRFAQLYHELEQEKEVPLLTYYLTSYASDVHEQECAWAIHFLRGLGLKRLVSTAQVSEIARSKIEFSESIFEACLDATGDLIETVSLVFPVSKTIEDVSFDIWMERIRACLKSGSLEKNEFILEAWKNLRIKERYLFNRIITNSFRPPVAINKLIKALAPFLELNSHQLAYNFYLSSLQLPASITELKKSSDNNLSLLPLPIVDPQVVEDINLSEAPANFTASYEWNGVRTQWIIAPDETHLWTRRGELITEKFPELQQTAQFFDDYYILDGVIVAYGDHALHPKSQVRNRMKRKRITNKIIADYPVYFCAFDLLKSGDTDLRPLPYIKRQKALHDLVKKLPLNDLIKFSDNIFIDEWSDLDKHWRDMRPLKSHAIILKRKNDAYGKKSIWYKFKAPVYSAKGVLLYVKRGEGALANQFTEYTLGARVGQDLIPFAKVEADFLDEDLLAIKAFVKNHTIERFGPVYSLEAQLIFEISYESVEAATRRKSGLVLKKPQFVQWHQNDELSDVVTLRELKLQIL